MRKPGRRSLKSSAGSLLLLVLLSSCVRAQPPTVFQTTAGDVYEIKACAGLGDEVWLGGTVQAPTDPSGQPTWTDGFLTRLGSDGRSLWQKRFGGEGGEGVRALAPLIGGGAVIAGYASTDLALAWAGKPKTDWERQAFLARVGDQGQLLASLDLRSGPGDVSESYVLLQSVACRADGHVWVGGRFEGSLWGLTSHGPQAFVGLLTPDFRLVRAYALDGYEVTHLRSQGEGCLAAGFRKGSQEQVVLWKLEASGSVAQAWAGLPAGSVACRQLEPDHLVFSENSQSWELDLEGWKRRALPDGVWATTLWKGSKLALGQGPTALPETAWAQSDEPILWSLEPSGWQPAWRFGSGRSDSFRFMQTSPTHLTLAGQTGGDLLGQSKAPIGQSRASWIRLFRLPEGNDLTRFKGPANEGKDR